MKQTSEITNELLYDCLPSMPNFITSYPKYFQEYDWNRSNHTLYLLNLTSWTINFDTLDDFSLTSDSSLSYSDSWQNYHWYSSNITLRLRRRTSTILNCLLWFRDSLLLRWWVIYSLLFYYIPLRRKRIYTALSIFLRLA